LSDFEFVFSLFGLLLGLALAEVLGGLGNAIQARRKVRIGWLTPLLGLLVAIDLTSFWMTAWRVREIIPPTHLSLYAGLAVIGLYYLIARLVFPSDLDAWPDLDAYYAEHKTWVLGGIIACNLLASAGIAALGFNPFGEWRAWAVTVSFVLPAVAAIVLRGRRVNAALLVYLVLLYPVMELV
jgi:hypothetical protein